MPSGTVASAFDPEARYAALDERVTNLGSRLTSFESNVTRSFVQIEASLTALSNEVRASGKTQWPVIWTALGVGFSILIGIGYLVYTPVKESNTNNAMAILRLTQTSVTHDELELRAARAAEDRVRIENILTGLQANKVGKDAIDTIITEVERRLNRLELKVFP